MGGLLCFRHVPFSFFLIKKKTCVCVKVKERRRVRVRVKKRVLFILFFGTIFISLSLLSFYDKKVMGRGT